MNIVEAKTRSGDLKDNWVTFSAPSPWFTTVLCFYTVAAEGPWKWFVGQSCALFFEIMIETVVLAWVPMTDSKGDTSRLVKPES